MSRVERGTEAQTRETIRKLAERAFDAHVLQPEGRDRWLCWRPDDCAHMFRLITAPYRVVVVGDVGEAILKVSSEDPVRWLRGFAGPAVPRDYIAGKIVDDVARRVFYLGDATAWLAENLADDPALLARTMATLRPYGDEEDPMAWYRAATDAGLDEAYDMGWGRSADHWWTVECLVWFARALVAAEAAETASAGGPP